MDRSKSLVMIWMWIGIGVAIFGVSIYGAETGADITPLVLVPMVMAFIATILMTLVPTERQQPAVEQAAKLKRESGGSLDLLLDMLDEDERAAFKEELKDRVLASAARLAEDEPEAVSLADLLGESGPRARSSG